MANIARSDLARMLYGEDDPDRIVAAGLHGLGGAPVRVALTWLSPCRFAVAADDRREVIDLGRVDTVRFSVAPDPAGAIGRAAGLASNRPAPARALVVLAGRDDMACEDGQCSDRRIFALGDPGRLEDARAAAVHMQRSACLRG